MSTTIKKFIPTFVTLIFGIGLNISGITIPWLGYSLMGLAVLLLLIPAWPYVKRTIPSQRKSRMIIALGIIMIIAGLTIVISQLDFHSKNLATNIPPNNPTDSNESTAVATSKIPTFTDMSKTDAEQPIFVTLGSASVGWPLSTLEKERKTAFNFNGAKIDMYVKDSKLYIDTDVSNGIDGYVVQIRGYSFLVKPDNWDKNFDDNAFEVVTENGKPVFQLILESQYHIIIYGIFPIPGGGVVWANEKGLMINPSPFDSFNLDPIFKYPSSEYPGKRINPSDDSHRQPVSPF